MMRRTSTSSALLPRFLAATVTRRISSASFSSLAGSSLLACALGPSPVAATASPAGRSTRQPHQSQQLRAFGLKYVKPEKVYVIPPPRYAVVDHRDAYRTALEGLHGQQLALAQQAGEGKDNPDYDPFLAEELEEKRRLREQRRAAARAGRVNEIEDTSPKKAKVAEDADNDAEAEEDDDDDEDEVEARDHENDMADLWKINKKVYNNDGSLKRNKSELAVLRHGAPAGGFVAVIKLPASQYKVTTEDVLIVNKLVPVEKWSVGSLHTLKDEDVLLLSSSSLTLVGMPYVPGAEVDVMVEEITQGARVIVFKKRRRKNSQRKKGFRRDITMLRVLDIRFPAKYADHEHVARPDPAPLVKKSAQAVIDFSAKLTAG